MTDKKTDDPWLTLAEIAEELHLTPATIRSWVSSGTLKAWRPGKRKYLVRRSELDRMLAGEDTWPSDDDPRPLRTMDIIEAPHRSPMQDPQTLKHISKGGWLGFAETAWRNDLRSSAMAPPDIWFILRLRRIAESAARKANAMASFGQEAEPPAWWYKRPRLGQDGLSYELKAGANRPGPRELWDKLDGEVQRLATERADESWAGEIDALSSLSLVIQEIADELEHRRSYPWVEDARRGDPNIYEIPKLDSPDGGRDEPNLSDKGVQ